MGMMVYTCNCSLVWLWKAEMMLMGSQENREDEPGRLGHHPQILEERWRRVYMEDWEPL